VASQIGEQVVTAAGENKVTADFVNANKPKLMR
jgi:hypothetical protein